MKFISNDHKRLVLLGRMPSLSWRQRLEKNRLKKVLFITEEDFLTIASDLIKVGFMDRVLVNNRVLPDGSETYDRIDYHITEKGIRAITFNLIPSESRIKRLENQRWIIGIIATLVGGILSLVVQYLTSII